jgi:hypothetical protein
MDTCVNSIDTSFRRVHRIDNMNGVPHQFQLGVAGIEKRFYIGQLVQRRACAIAGLNLPRQAEFYDSPQRVQYSLGRHADLAGNFPGRDLHFTGVVYGVTAKHHVNGKAVGSEFCTEYVHDLVISPEVARETHVPKYEFQLAHTDFPAILASRAMVGTDGNEFFP